MDVNKTLNFNIIPELVYNSPAVLKLENNFRSDALILLIFSREIKNINAYWLQLFANFFIC